ATAIEIGTINTARARPLKSASIPMIGGEMASPSAWMTKMQTAIAIARIPGGTMLTITTLTGPVLRKRKNSAIKRLGLKIMGDTAVRASQAGRMAATVAPPESHRCP